VVPQGSFLVGTNIAVIQYLYEEGRDMIRDRIKELRRIPASELQANPKNWRRHPLSQEAALRGVLEEIGFADALICRETSDGLELIDGHLRKEVMEDQTVPVLVVDVNEDEAQKMIMTLDPLGAMAETDQELFGDLLEQIEFADESVQRMLEGLNNGSYHPLLAAQKSDEEDASDTASETEKAEAEGYEPFSKFGQVWSLGSHRLMCGDCTDKKSVDILLDGNTPNLMITDPPYGVNYRPEWRNEAAAKGQLAYGGRRIGLVTEDNRADWSEAWQMFKGDIVYCWSAAGALQIASGLALQSVGFEIRASIMWRKPHFPISRGHYTFQHEPCWYAVRKGRQAAWIGPANASTVWDIPLDKNVSPDAPDGGHSTQKPLECMRRPMEYHKGDVYDPFVGTGTTVIASEYVGRRCYAMEIEPRYVDVSIRRWEIYTGKKAVLL